MRTIAIALVGMITLSLSAAFLRADDAKTADQTWTGAIVDNMCSGKVEKAKDVQADAMKHPVACALKDACSESGYSLFVDGKRYKLDDASNAKAKEYLAKEGATTAATITGTMKDGVITVTSIAAPTEKKG